MKRLAFLFIIVAFLAVSLSAQHFRVYSDQYRLKKITSVEEYRKSDGPQYAFEYDRDGKLVKVTVVFYPGAERLALSTATYSWDGSIYATATVYGYDAKGVLFERRVFAEGGLQWQETWQYKTDAAGSTVTIYRFEWEKAKTRLPKVIFEEIMDELIRVGC